jgi:hypothetical protein
VTGTLGDEPLDPLLGQPRMMADPRISVDQAAEVLGKTAAQVRRMITLGRLPRRGAPGKFRGLLLSDVLCCRQRGEPITFAAAAEILDCSKAQIRRLIADQRLALVPGTQRRVYENDVRQLASRRPHPSRTGPPAPESPDGHIDTAAAAAILGASIRSTQRLAAAERIPAYRDSAGRYWYRSEQLHLVRRARIAAAENRR